LQIAAKQMSVACCQLVNTDEESGKLATVVCIFYWQNLKQDGQALD